MKWIMKKSAVALTVALTVVLGCLCVSGAMAGDVMSIRGESLVLATNTPGTLCFDQVKRDSFSLRSTYDPAKTNSIIYVEGQDYVVDYAGGTVARTGHSRIPDYAKHCLYGVKDFKHGAYPDHSNHKWFVWADYETTNGHAFAEPNDQRQYLVATRRKLEAGGAFRIVSYGDSITAGGEASELRFRFQQRFAAHLRDHFPKAEIEVQDVSISGYTSQQGVDWFDKKPANMQQTPAMGKVERPDLVLVGFGMNDHNIEGFGVPVMRFKANLIQLVGMIRKRYGSDVILFSAFPPNAAWHYGSHQMTAYAHATQQAAAEMSCAYVDVYSVWKRVLQRKDQPSLLNNNINHPNDFGHWLYAQAFEAMTF